MPLKNDNFFEQEESKLDTLPKVYAREREADSIVIPPVREARDLVYSGTMREASKEFISGSEQLHARNRKGTRRKVSPFNIVMLLIGIAVAVVLYISNILTVGRLLIQINNMQAQHVKLLSEQELLRAQLNKLSSLERIQKISIEELQLRNPAQVPASIEINPERVEELQQVLDKLNSERE